MARVCLFSGLKNPYTDADLGEFLDKHFGVFFTHAVMCEFLEMVRAEQVPFFVAFSCAAGELTLWQGFLVAYKAFSVAEQYSVRCRFAATFADNSCFFHDGCPF